MKWLAPTGSTQMSSDGRYLVMQANSKDWVAYFLARYENPEKIGEPLADLDAGHSCCEAHEALLVSARQIA